MTALLELHEQHRGAFEYDWRTRFNKSLACIPQKMSWGEAYRLTEILLLDPSSQVASAVAGWQYPLTRGELTARDMYDLQHQSKSKRKIKSYPRPWDAPPNTFGAGASLSIAEFRAIKAEMVPQSQPRDARGRFKARD